MVTIQQALILKYVERLSQLEHGCVGTASMHMDSHLKRSMDNRTQHRLSDPIDWVMKYLTHKYRAPADFMVKTVV
jgi:hypothetical protein